MTFPNASMRAYAGLGAPHTIRWDVDRDVIRGRRFDFTQKFMPDGLSLVGRLDFLTPAERLLLGQVQGRTYANMGRLVSRFIGGRLGELGRDLALRDRGLRAALGRFAVEELKHRELFRRIELLAAEGMPPGYAFVPQIDDVASFALGRSPWAILAFACQIEIFTQVHYRQSIEHDAGLSGLWKDVFFFHWKEDLLQVIQHGIDHDGACIDARERDGAVDDLMALVMGVDALLRAQAPADADYFANVCGEKFTTRQVSRLRSEVLAAYRWQYLVSGISEPRFAQLMEGLAGTGLLARIDIELAPILQ